MQRFKCEGMNHPTRARSFDGSVVYRDHGKLTQCRCESCRKATKASVWAAIARELPAYMAGARK